MAQTSITTMSMPTSALATTDGLLEMKEYHRIVKFRDDILSGHHPRIKIPAPAGGAKAAQGTQQPTAQNSASATTSSRNEQNVFVSSNLKSFKANSQQPAIVVPVTKPSDTAPRPLPSSKTQIDPLLLTKSDELIKAELHLQRQRLERSLREEIEAQRAASKSNEQAADLDLSDILAKALTLVQATAPPLTETDLVANAPSVSSDSFDDNTFYSSQHDTPEPEPRPQAQAPTAGVPVQNATSVQTRADVSEPKATHDHTLVPSPFLSRAEQPHMSGAPKAGNGTYTGPNTLLQDTSNAHDSRYSPTYDIDTVSLGLRPGADELHAQVISSNGSGTTSRSGNSGDADLERRADYNRLQATLPPPQNNRYGFGEPLVRAHDLSPYAPQPSHVSPLALARHQQSAVEPEISILQGAPAPVAALRLEQGNGTSPESSPQGEKGGKKKNKKKNKRKAAETRSTDRPVSPIIKPEPRSPSPLTSPQFARPQKRQRPLAQTQAALDYDDNSRNAQPVPVRVIEDVSAHPREYESVYNPYPTEVRYSAVPGSQWVDRPVYEERRPESRVQYIRRAQSPTYASPHGAGEVRPMRSATYSMAEPVYREPSAFRREGRMSVRPVVDRARSRSPIMVEARQSGMAPPRPPTHIFRDEFGREYMEPPRPPPSVSRYSAAPPSRLAEADIIYEQAPLRSSTRMPGPDTFERDGVLYRRASPLQAARRIITQPEYGVPDYREYRQREYSARPAPTPSAPQELLHYRSEGRAQQEFVPEYGIRASTVRPPEQNRYEYPARVASVRPDAAVRDYATSTHPEVRREVPIPVYREYSSRPAFEQEPPRREYSVRPVERYYENRPVLREDEMQYIDQPRTVQREIIYEDGLREVYR
ncbi:hypothetical protein PFICI_05610 [Pestalotiopsis fici W106-1]|uniref:Uncharacterized protein n=1 Tax=Pestalotiopsis fici (strain W106-1 / CGMCC3.15140) TaxID=1229662 RepID=W3XCL3_PESFW|nr:uncharacterized protein PFICI_05610 [Pestalotiopsis fici W106-1]ETS83734.1 hypothetical protein PFICI_05610 [Pestalotiopsis fici W106-1]